MQSTVDMRRRVRRTAGISVVVGVTALGLVGCGSDDDQPDDTEINVITSDVTATSIVTVDSEVTVGTTMTSEVEVVEDTTMTSEVEVPGTVTEVSEVLVTSAG